MSETIQQSNATLTAVSLAADGLGSGSMVQTPAIAMGTALDCRLYFHFEVVTGATLAANANVTVFVATESVSGYSGGAVAAPSAPGTSAGNFTGPTANLRVLGQFSISAAGLTSTNDDPSMVNLGVLFPTSLPNDIILIVQNNTGGALTGTVGQSTANLCSYSLVNADTNP